MPQMRLALAQVNATVGDLAANADLVVDYCKQAVAKGVIIVVAVLLQQRFAKPAGRSS